ncbi:MAG: MerR family transcriptional regulator [Luteitalea sp.]|nr:MerR family transcriptional regulator [Luteitalea sp.]
MADLAEFVIPDRPAFKAGEVCEIAKIKPYVLRTWESEFPDLGLSKTPGGPRIYRRADVERVVRIRQLVFGDGLTLAGARRQLEQEQAPTAPDVVDSDDMLAIAAQVEDRARAGVLKVKEGLRSLLSLLDDSSPIRASQAGREEEPQGRDFELQAPEAPVESSEDRVPLRRPTRNKRSR